MEIGSKSRFIKDVIHNEIVFKQNFALELLKSKELIRLTRIKQLGLTYRLFPNASHTRFVHSLGTYCLANRVIKQLNCFKQSEINELTAAALLHDFGHGPHSHAFEQYTGINHEHYSKAIIMSPHTDVNKVLKKYSISPENVCAILDHKHPNEFLNDLISSQIDVDRLDYLARDSHFTGVSYGHIDTTIILKWLKIRSGKICFAYKAIPSLENFLLSRYHMYEAVYEQPKTVAMQQLIRKMLQRFKYLYNHNRKSIVNKFNLASYFEPWLKNKEFSVDQYLLLDDTKFEMFVEQMQFEKDPQIKEAFKLYDEFTTKDYKVVANTKANKSKYLKRLKSKTKYPNLYMHECLVKTKSIYKTKQQPIYVYDEFGSKVRTLDQVSPIIKALADKTKPRNYLVINNNI